MNNLHFCGFFVLLLHVSVLSFGKGLEKDTQRG